MEEYARKLNEKRLALLASGVRMMDPSSVYVAETVTVGEGTLLLPGTILRGDTVIGPNCEIGPNTMLTNCKVGEGTMISFSQCSDSTIGCNTHVGPFAYIRPDCTVGDHVKVGDFVEVKNSVLGNGTKISHLTYVGDSDVGEDVNFGCGTVTVNYDGLAKHRTVIGNGCFIGCNTNLVAPVTLGDGCYTAAGSTITKNVSQGALAIARVRQTERPGWAENRKAAAPK